MSVRWAEDATGKKHEETEGDKQPIMLPPALLRHAREHPELFPDGRWAGHPLVEWEGDP